MVKSKYENGKQNPVYSFWIKFRKHMGTVWGDDFQTFAVWYGANHKEGYKMVSVKGLFGPDTTFFLPAVLASLMKVRDEHHRKYALPQGVTKSGSGFYMAQARNKDRQVVNLGTYTRKELAHEKWKQFRIEEVRKSAEDYYRMGVISFEVKNFISDNWQPIAMCKR